MTVVKVFVIVFTLFISMTNADSEKYDCGTEVHDPSIKGSISSPFYGERRYPGQLTCHYQISAIEGQRIKITFKDFDVYPSKTCMYDHLLISSMNDETTLAHICGNQLPRPILSDEGDGLLLTFYTEFENSGRGFHLEYESGPDLELCEPDSSVCGNRNCYSPNQKCDGVDNCGDGTDEEDCNHPVLILPEDCGIQAIKPKTFYDRIVGGEEVTPNSWPWQVSLNFPTHEPNGHFCGGTLINAQWVLTATHCVEQFPSPGEIKILLGVHSLVNTTSYQQTRRSTDIIAYPDLTGEKMKNYTVDLALIKLNAPVTFNAGVQPACLPDFEFRRPPGFLCYQTGWGETRGSGGSYLLKQVLAIVQTKEECYDLEEDSLFCVWKEKNGGCHGDSGGPLNCRIRSKWYVFGAASFVITDTVPLLDDERTRCGVGHAPTVYDTTLGRVSWIKNIINQYS